MGNRLSYFGVLLLTAFSFIAKGQIDNALFEAIKNCDTHAVQLRIKANININATDSNGATALMWAGYYCDVPLVKLLVQHGAKATDTGVVYIDAENGVYFTSLQGIAAFNGKLELLRYISDTLHMPIDERDYDPGTQKKDSWTPLSSAVSTGKIEVVRYLLQKGADVNVINPEGSTPLIMAAQNEDWALFDLLIKGGAKEKLGEQIEDLLTTAAELSKQGSVKGDWNKDLALQQFILQLKRIYFGEEHFAYAGSLNYLAYLYYLMGRYEKALPLYDKAKAIAKKTLGEEHYFYAGILHNIAYLYKDLGLLEKALPYLQESTSIAKKTLSKELPDYATSLQSLASLYKDMGQFEKALPLMSQAAAIRKKALGEGHSAYALSLRELAGLYHKMGQDEKALSLLEQAVSIRKNELGEEHPFYAGVLFNLADLYHQTSRYEKALPLYEQVIAIQKKTLGEEHPDYVQSLNGLASLYYDKKQYNKALALFADASSLTLKHIVRTYATLSEQEKMALLYKKSSQFSYLPSLLFTQGFHRPSILQQVYDHQLALKGMILEDQKAILNHIRKSKDSVALQLYNRWFLNKVFLGKQMLLPVKERVAQLDSIEEVTNQLEQQLSESSMVFRIQQQKQDLSPTSIVQKLSGGEAAIEFISFKIYKRRWTDSTMYAALVVAAGDSAINFVPLFEERQLKQLLQAADANSYEGIERLYGRKETLKNNLPYALYQLIWKPLERYLQNVHTVHYAPAGLLHRIAFQAIPINSDTLLIDKYQLKQLLSTRSIVVPAEVVSKPLSVQIWGNITYSLSNNSEDNYIASSRGNRKNLYKEIEITPLSSFNLFTMDRNEKRGEEEGWKPLPFTKTEMDSLHAVFTRFGINSVSLSGSRATEEAFKALNGKSPQVLHLATHGFFLPVRQGKPVENSLSGSDVFTVQQNPMFRSGLILAGGNHAWKGESIMEGMEDGILTAYEIAQLDLSGTDLIVLSACETALGDINNNEGVIGLQRALKMAGVKQMIVSLWQVPDKATMELMTSFYKNWLGGQPVREALRKAQLQLKEKYKHPYFWAAFVLVE